MPSLFSFRLCAGGLLDASLAGVSHADVSLTLPPPPPPPPPPAAPGAAAVPSKAKGGGKKRRRGAAPVQSRGPLLVTHRGVSGPAALKLSAFGATQLHEAGYRGTLRLNLAPGLAPAEARAALQAFQNREARRAPRAPPRAARAARVPSRRRRRPCAQDTRRKQVRNVNPFGVPARLWEAVACAGSDEAEADGARKCAAAPWPPATPPSRRSPRRRPPARVRALSCGRWAQLTPAQLDALQRRACEAELAFSGKDSNKDEFVTAGGVSWAGVDAKRMQSKHVAGLFFAGELLNVDGITGGHNFQSCWTTGMVAGTEAARVALDAAEIATGSTSES